MGNGFGLRCLAMVAGAAVALSVGAATAPPASAWSELTHCTITVYNNTNYTMQLYNSVGYGSVISPEDPHSLGFRDAPFAPTSISPNDSAGFYTESTWPISTHCSINLWFELQTPDGSGWSQTLETYVYDPNSGHNNAWSSATGDFAARASVVAVPQDQNTSELMTVTVGPNASGASRAAGPAGEAASRPREPKRAASLLRRGDLTGGSWRPITRVGDLGRLGRILSAAKVPASCRDTNKKSQPLPLKEGLSAFSRRGGAEFIGAGHGIYATAKQARQTSNDMVSVHSIGCLARLLTSKRFHTSVSTERRSVTLAGSRLSLNRLKVRTRSGARITGTDYVDLIGVLHAKANALLIFASDKRPPEARREAAAIKAVVRRLP